MEKRLLCCNYLNQSQYPGSNTETEPEIKLVPQYNVLFSLPANITTNAWLQHTICLQPNYSRQYKEIKCIVVTRSSKSKLTQDNNSQ